MSDDDRRDGSTADEAVARLRATDPAASAEPDAGRLERLTTERRGDQLAARRDRQPRRWSAIAAVAAGALVVGGTGYAVGASSHGTADRSGGTFATVEQSGGDIGGPAFRLGEEFAPRPDVAASSAAPFMHPMLSARTTFTASGLSTDGGRASAWAFDAAATYSAATAARVAEVLGVEGEPTQEHGSWRVGAADGTGPSLNLGGDGAVSVHYSDPELYPLLDAVVEPMPMPAPGSWPAGDGDGSNAAGTARADDGGVAEPGPTPTPVGPDGAEPGSPDTTEPGSPDTTAPDETAPVPEGVPAADVSGEAAVLHRTLTELGVDAASAVYATESFDMGEDLVSVTARQLLDGRRTGYEWNAVIDGDRIYSFSGPLAEPVGLGQYDVVSPTEAVERLGDPRFGATPVWSGQIEVMPLSVETPGWSWGDPPGPPPAAGAAIPWPVTDVAIVAAELTITQQASDNGSILLLPAYELSDAEGRTWSVLAVADHQLAF